MKTEDLHDLFVYIIEGLLAAEKQVDETAPAIIEKAVHKSLKNALEHHHTESKKHISRLQKILSLPAEEKEKKRGNIEQKQKDIAVKESKGARGLIEEANEMLSLKMDNDVRDAVIIDCMQKIEHYEIVAYNTALSLAAQLQFAEAEILLQETLHEERDASELLTTLSFSITNKELAVADEESNAGSNSSRKKTNTGSITERSIQSPGGQAGTSHRQYGDGESRGH